MPTSRRTRVTDESYRLRIQQRSRAVPIATLDSHVLRDKKWLVYPRMFRTLGAYRHARSGLRGRGCIGIRDLIRLGTLIVGKESQGSINMGSAGRSVDYMYDSW
jgi:hypothetical protein